MFKRKIVAATLPFVALMLVACRDPVDGFFSGRPSGMAMVHNGALDGRVESMRAILEVPARFPAANDQQRGHWQESLIAWWLAPGGRQRIEAALGQLRPEQQAAVLDWLGAPAADGEKKQAAQAELRRHLALRTGR